MNIYHCAQNLPAQLDLVQTMCKAICVPIEDALLSHNLAPLRSRRDMAMLGLIHRSVIGSGPDHFRNHFRRATPSARPHGREAVRNHTRQLLTYRNGKFLEILTHSVLGLIDIYNLLPEYVVMSHTVKIFQHRLQELMKVVVTKGISS